MDAKLSFIKLADIVISHTNPRKFFDQHKIDELADSIKEKGVIQPILLRTKGDKFELVCGERRWRASKQAARKDIPAVIRQLDDQEVREIQLIENFQREDPHPMEEAVAILEATTTGKYTVEELATKVGKSKKYIAQRLKLNDLIPALQKAFYENKINLTGALKLVTISTADQENFYKKADANDYYYTIDQIGYFIKQAQGNLDKAPFDLEDATLTSFGACTTCPFNSRNANLLFPDDSRQHLCMNNQDYIKKTEVHYDRASKHALEDPTIVLIGTNYSKGPDEKKLESQGHVVLDKYTDYHIIEQPRKDDIFKDEYETEEEYDEALQIEQQDYEAAMIAYEQKVASGKLVKAFVVAGENKGAYVHVELLKKGEQKAAASNLTNDNAGTGDIDAEINRLNERETRNKELDQEKVYKQISEALLKHDPYLNATNLLSTNEFIAVAISIIESVGYDEKKAIYARLGIKDSFDTNALNLLFTTLTKMEGEALPVIFNMLRKFILHKNINQYHLNPLQHGDAAAINLVAVDYIPDNVVAFAEEQKQVSDKRIDKLNKRIADLQLQKKALEKEAKPKKKKSVKVLLAGKPTDMDKRKLYGLLTGGLKNV